MKEHITRIIENYTREAAFSGVIAAQDATGTLFARAYGLRSRQDGLENELSTAFAIASGTKLLTALAILRLVAAGKLSLDTALGEALAAYPLGTIDPAITIRQLLTHTSGVGDYIDEEAEDSMAPLAALYDKYPVYRWESMAYYLPMSNALPAKFAPGERFSYSNTGFVLLGLVAEAVSGQPFQTFVTEEIIRPLGLVHTGFYRLDSLPANTALGYFREDGQWRSNIYRLPVIGGADGGLFTCAADMDTLWRALMAGRLLPDALQAQMLAPQVRRYERDDQDFAYGLGVYCWHKNKEIAWYAVGGDFGVDFFSACFPGRGLTITALGNTEENTFPILRGLFDTLTLA